jgi:prolyl-tRNA synthetase
VYLIQTNLEKLRKTVEQGKGFQIAIAPMQPATFLNVKIATDKLYKGLIDAGISVLVDDRNQKPKNMFEVINFLGIRHRLVISSRSISAGVYEYKDLLTGEFEKINETEALEYLKQRLADVN